MMRHSYCKSDSAVSLDAVHYVKSKKYCHNKTFRMTGSLILPKSSLSNLTHFIRVLWTGADFLLGISIVVGYGLWVAFITH
jgi:hypothetical protein